MLMLKKPSESAREWWMERNGEFSFWTFLSLDGWSWIGLFLGFLVSSFWCLTSSWLMSFCTKDWSAKAVRIWIDPNIGDESGLEALNVEHNKCNMLWNPELKLVPNESSFSFKSFSLVTLSLSLSLSLSPLLRCDPLVLFSQLSLSAPHHCSPPQPTVNCSSINWTCADLIDGMSDWWKRILLEEMSDSSSNTDNSQSPAEGYASKQAKRQSTVSLKQLRKRIQSMNASKYVSPTLRPFFVVFVSCFFVWSFMCVDEQTRCRAWKRAAWDG